MRARRFVVSLAFALASVTLALQPAAAQERSGNGFLFGAPNGSLSLRMGYTAPAAGSDLFGFVTNELTLRRSDLGAFAFGADFAVSLRRQLDLVVSADFGGTSQKTEFREWQDNSGNPIEQTTSFSRQSYTANLRYYLLPYGRSLGRFAWVPTRYAPWVGAGLGRTHYSFKQVGDFVDFANGNAVFGDTFYSSAWGFTPQAAAGIDYNLNPRFALTGQAKYLWGKADLGVDFSGFSPIDLSGFGLTGGLTIRF